MSANTETTGADFEHQALCPVERGGSCNCVPIAAPAAHKIEVRATVDGKCPLCGVAVPSTHIHVCGGSLRPTALAAYVERRKGQRWHMRNVKLGADFSGVLAEDTGATWKLSDVVAMDGEGTDRRFRADMWATPGTTMTLLADAPPEPLTAKDVFGEIPPGSKFTNDTPVKFASAPPAQEAPKAAPVCERCKSAIGVLMTGFDSRQFPACSLCRIKLAAWVSLQTGKPYAGPERLPRPQLAADWVEDCLPESGR